MPVTVFRIGHRPERDKRVTTHCALVARAFGANKMVYSGVRDEKMEASVSKVASEWGGGFSIEYCKHWKKFVKDYSGKIIHLTMYGKAFPTKKPSENTMVIIGGEKVPAEVYELADFNCSVGNQPHSEIGALAVVLYEWLGIAEFKGSKTIVPQEKGKLVTTQK